MKKILMSILAAGLAFAMITNTNTANAVEKESATSEASVQFSAPTGSVNALNPDKPHEELIQENHDGEVTEQSGPLSLDYVSNIRFSNENEPLEITSKTMNYESVSSKPFVQVSDFRGTGEGWRLIASATNFTSESEKDDPTLLGSKISFIGGSTASPEGGVEPMFNENQVKLSGSEEQVSAVQLETGKEPVPVITANAKKDNEVLSESPGQGTWLMKWYSELKEDNKNPNVVLTVIGNTASPGLHTSTINWTLENGPDGK